MPRMLVILFLLGAIASCNSAPEITINKESTTPGTHLFAGDKRVELYKGSVAIGDNLNDLLEQKMGQRPIKEITVVNIVPSIDTKVCEAQTHLLGESKKLKSSIAKITISRDLPMAQSRFAREAKLENITYLSDYKTGDFGKSTGLMMKGSELLARGVIVTDAKGIIKYIQIVTNVYHLPDMDRAFNFANKLKK
ncbi:hypothetical protein A9Q84_10795 [Halobacteriovorax marinus]|uniref:Redoxin domain-containing protein n=1 Tax=Halobacteriovorax marinus TaxID=97084 RepID=A0A1Y5F7C8_9BACT|nr:hypothetical protein A9Q84_10795 [Halobacteriovorax marinus]